MYKVGDILISKKATEDYSYNKHTKHRDSIMLITIIRSRESIDFINLLDASAPITVGDWWINTYWDVVPGKLSKLERIIYGVPDEL